MYRYLVFMYIFLEIFAIYTFVDEFGFFTFFIEVIVSAMLGLVFMAKFGFVSMRNLNSVINLINNFGVSIGSFLILMPGILCDITGFCIIIFSVFSRKNIDESNNIFKKYSEDEDIIDVEIINEDKK